MITEKRDVYLLTVAIFILGAIIDMVISYIAYLDMPLRFVYLEANKEAISFFKNNIIPIKYILVHILAVILYTGAYWFIYVNPSKFKTRFGEVAGKLSFSILSILYMIVGVIHIFGGLTWFDDTGLVIFGIVEGLTVLSSVIAIVTLALNSISITYTMYYVRKYGEKGRRKEA